ncbi:hypothetical protein CEXT_458901 [Caerostris extrusa]|uniref:Uncharacterized protein n=1 Tax=Caerostris extrusa TaxID=172846 RepID=A0AAV4MN29_CAEEX|nr:hypothetical protein CEXT_458901 [Caerostris extrusa]
MHKIVNIDSHTSDALIDTGSSAYINVVGGFVLFRVSIVNIDEVKGISAGWHCSLFENFLAMATSNNCEQTCAAQESSKQLLALDLPSRLVVFFIDYQVVVSALTAHSAQPNTVSPQSSAVMAELLTYG